MLSAGPLALGVPLTHRAFIAATANGSRCVCVQARRHHRDGPYWLCAEVLELGAGDTEWFKVRSAIDDWWASSRDLRLCSPDGRCACDDSADTRRPTAKPARSTDRATTEKTEQPCGFQRGCDVQPTGHPTP